MQLGIYFDMIEWIIKTNKENEQIITGILSPCRGRYGDWQSVPNRESLLVLGGWSLGNKGFFPKLILFLSLLNFKVFKK